MTLYKQNYRKDEKRTL
jgi:hypothetical protein